ncbi:MAG: hypothetical protein KBD67_08210 [Anaerolineaceae bacterium]|nr:hypothetical protein [Anaerolineaceae bacterium]
MILTSQTPPTDEVLAPLPFSCGMLVVFGAHGGAVRMLDFAARLSLYGPLYLLDCGNRSNMYRVARTLRTLTNDPIAMMRNIHLSRAFTCYQVTALLEKATQNPGTPVLVLDLLTTFMDESIRVEESSVLFSRALQYLTVMSASAPVLVSASPLLSLSAPRFGLLERLKQAATEVWEENALPTTQTIDAQQLSLFADS